MLQKTALIIGALSLISGVFSDDCPSFFNKDDNGNCTIRQCTNGGYLDVSKQICICPSGYLGIHCEAVKTSLPPDNHFKVGGTSFNIININLYTEYWGVSTYANIQKGLEAHFDAYPTGYDNYNLVETRGTPYLDNIDQPQYDSISFNYDNINSNISFSLADLEDTGIYWCYEVAIYENLIQMIQKGGLKNTVITIVTQHPPLAEFHDEARQIAVAFGIRINVLWISDIVFNACSDEQISDFKTFVDITGGLFVQLQAENGDQNNINLISQVLLTHYKPQYVSIQSFPDCTSGQIIPVVADPVVSGPYNFVFLGASANPTIPLFTACHLRQPLRSYDNQLAIFQSPDPTNPDCANLNITTASGGCTGIVFTNAAPASGPLDLAISTTYVENPSIDASRYAIVEGVPFYPALHVESNPTAQITLNSISASFDRSWNPQLQKRSPAAFEWIPSTTIKCDSTKTYSLFLNISVDLTIVQRAVRVACVPVPVITTTTAAATTTEPLASTTTGEASSTTTGEASSTTTGEASSTTTGEASSTTTGEASSTTTGEASSTTTGEASSTTTGEATSVAATTSSASSTVVTSTEMPSSTSQAVCTTQDNSATFLFAYAADFDPTTYGLVSRTIGSYVTANLPTGQTLANVLTDLTTEMDIKYTNVANDFTTNCVTDQPDATLARSEVQASTALQTIQQFLKNANATMRLEGSIIILLVNRLPKNDDDLISGEYDQLTNLNVKIFPIITIRNLVEHSAIASRSGAVFNRIAAQTNGHYIVANDTIGVDVNSDFNKIIANFMKTSYNQNLLFVRNIGSNRFLSLGSSIGTLRIPKSPTESATVPVTITVSLSAVDTNVPQLPRRLLLAILGNSKFNQTKTVQIDFLNPENVTSFANSNYYTTTVNLDAGIENNLILLYDAGPDQNDVLIRMWTPNAIHRSASYVNAKSEPLTPVNKITESTGAALKFTLENQCSSDKTATLLITDCNGEVSAKYDSDQIFNWKDNSTFYQFVPFFCDNQPTPTTCISGAESKYDAQFVSNDFSVTQSFQCRPGNGPTDNCKLKDSNGNYQCSGTSPFMRGPEGSLTDCSGHGHLEYDEPTKLFSCICDPGFSGPSCEIVTCTNQNTDPLAKDNAYHTYTVVVGLEKTNGFLVFDDAKVLFGLPGLNGTVDLPEVWKYQLLTICADGVFDMIYSGSDLGEFQRLFTSPNYELLARTCNTPPSPGVNDLTTIYKEAVKGIGRNVKGIIVYFSEVSSMINVTLDEFIAASQPYQQQFFVYAVDETSMPILPNGERIAKAAMTTGGFLIQSYITDDVKGHLDTQFIPDFLQSSTSIAWYSSDQVDDFTYFTQNNIFAYVITWNVGDNFKINNGVPFRNCQIAGNENVECKIQGPQTVKGNIDRGAFYVAVYLLDDPLIPKVQIISDLDRDSSNAVSTSSSDTRTMLTFNIPEEYDIVANSGDGGVTRNAQRNGCTFDWTAYSVFATQKYTPGLNIAKITLQDASSNTYTRFFPFGTSSAPVCQNGGTPIQSDGSCLCPSGFQGSDCSLVNCSQSSTSNAWSDVCVCNEIDDATCARQFTSIF